MQMRWLARSVALVAITSWTLQSDLFAQGIEMDTQARVGAIVELMTEMSEESRVASAQIRAVYRPELDNALRDRPALIRSLESGDLARLPENPAEFNLDLRLAGAHPIAERDLIYQPIYVAARPATLGALFAVAARVQSGPVEVASLVRHFEYQQALRRTNPNATTEVPTHRLGLAFDISVLNMSLETVREVRDVLRAMSDAGDLYVVAESRQLVFHVVPTPERLAFFEALYDGLMTLSPDPYRAVVVARVPAADAPADVTADGMQ